MWLEILRDFTDYRDYMGLSSMVWLCKWSLLGLISYNLVGSVTLLVRHTATGRGCRHHWPLVQARGAYGRRGPRSGRHWDSPFSGWRSRGSALLPHNITRGRHLRSLFIPRRGARRGTRRGTRRGRMLLGARSSGCRRRLLRGLRCGIPNSGYRSDRLWPAT